MKQTCSKILALLILTLTTIQASAYDFEVNGIYYTILQDKNSVEVTRFKENTSYYIGDIIIPEQVTYQGTTYHVTSIGNDAFYYCSRLTSIEIPNSVTSIGNYAFSGCSSLTSIEIPNSVNSIGSYAFSGCRSLTSIEIPNCVTSIGNYAFHNCSSLTSIEIPNSVTSIGNYAFSGCSSLTSIEIPNSVIEIGSSAFSGCSSITSLTFNAENCTSCGSSSSPAFPPSISTIIFGDKVTEIPAYLLYNGSKIESLAIPNSVTSIGSYAFYDCNDLTSIEIPNSVTSIGGAAFGMCTSLKAITVEEGNPEFKSHEGVVYDTTLSELKICPAGLTNVIIPGSVTSIGDHAFRGCNSLTSIDIPSSVTFIGTCAFCKCNSLTSIEIPTSVTSIGFLAFSYCSSLSSIEIPNSVTSIGMATFVGCSSLTSIEIPNSVTSIGESAFEGCSNLTSIEIPNSVTSIGGSAFEGCSNLTSIEIPNSVTSIGSVAFSDCSSLTSIKIPNSVTSIEVATFGGCSSLKSIEIPNSVTSIGSGAFYNCSSLREVVIPNKVISIGAYAFNGCNSIIKSAYPNNLTNPFRHLGVQISYNPDEAVIEEGIIFGSNMKELYYAPLNLSGKYSIPESITSIGSYAFFSCSDLSEVEIPNSVTSIGEYCFYASGLTNMTFNAEKCIIESDALPNQFATITIGASLKEFPHNFNASTNKAFWLGNTPPDGAKRVQAKVNYVSNDLYSFANQEVYPFLSSKFEVDGDIYIPVSPSERTCDLVVYHKDTETEDVTIPGTVTNRGIEMNVTGLGQYLFYNHDYITSLTVPNTVEEIGNYALSGCKSLTNFTLEDADEDSAICHLGSNGSKSLFSDCQLNELYIGRKLSYDADSSHGYSPFYHNETLSTVEISDAETQIYENEFYGCTNLSSLKVGNGVKTIGNRAFSGCSKLDYFSVGNNVETIGEEAFSDCTGLRKFYSYAEVPPVCGNQALDDISKWECTLYVPASSSDEYRAAPQWKDFFYIEEMDAVLVAEIRLNATELTMKVGETYQLTAEILPNNATDESLVWTSSDPKVVSVDSNGLLTALAAGDATITVKSADGNSEASCAVSILPESGIEELFGEGSVGECRVYDLQGKLVLEADSAESIKQLPAGFYIISVNGNSRKVFIK